MKLQRDLTQVQIVIPLRSLVGKMFTDLFGSYGDDCYEGQYEEEIQGLAELIANLIEENSP